MRSLQVIPHAEPEAAAELPLPATAWQGVVAIPDETLGAIAEIRYLRDYDDGIYRDLDVELTLDYMRRRFVTPLSRHVDIAAATLLDCASGFGWLAFAYLLAGGRHATLVEMSAPRLDAARAIARLLGIADRCSFRDDRLQDIAIDDDGADVFASIETLEHVGRENVRASLHTMARVAKRAIILTTPNFLFPILAHDTELPFAHWLPAGLRRRYASAAGRGDLDRGNEFLMPWDLAPLLVKFRPASRFQTFATRKDYERFFPHYLPYGARPAQRYRANPRSGQRFFQMALAATIGRYSFALAPNLASLWLRRN
jgi:ubiquinone/menaquinone biosynthesis C-methylase UbiE